MLLLLAFPLTLTACTSGKKAEDATLGLIPAPKEVKGKPDKNGKFPRGDYPATIQNAERSWNESINAFCDYSKKLHDTVFTISEEGAIRIVWNTGLASGEYRLEITKKQANLLASDLDDLNHGLSTLLQLMKKRDAGGITLPILEMTDRADCSWRGMMVNLARNWHDFSFLLDDVDMCYYDKISILHLHFTDSQSYTLPSDAYPDLPTQGKQYTKEQIRELVDYAQARGVLLMPEIDIPGHCEPFTQAYPKLFGINGIICQHEDTFGFGWPVAGLGGRHLNRI